jgi:hypothetical protein
MDKIGLKLAKHIICACGLASDTVGNVTIDGKVALIQPHPESILYLCPIKPNPHPSYQEACFFSDCIAYEHDIPAIVCPTSGEIRKFKHRFIHYGDTKPQEMQVVSIGQHAADKEEVTIHTVRPVGSELMTKTFYMPTLINILEEIRVLRHGPFTSILFKYYKNHCHIDLPFKKKYGQMAKEIHLYATALKQAETLSEYLSYYRVIESVAGKRHKRWIETSLSKISRHYYGEFPMTYTSPITGPCKRPKNLLTVYRRRALLRLKNLFAQFGSPSKVGEYLYNVNRCGIAHGQKILRSDLTPSYFDVIKDTYIMKLLARIAIDENIK